MRSDRLMQQGRVWPGRKAADVVEDVLALRVSRVRCAETTDEAFEWAAYRERPTAEFRSQRPRYIAAREEVPR